MNHTPEAHESMKQYNKYIMWGQKEGGIGPKLRKYLIAVVLQNLMETTKLSIYYA